MSSRFILLALLLALILGLRFWLFFANHTDYKNGSQARFSSRLSEEPDLISGEQRFSLIDTSGTRITVITSSNKLYHYGDNLFIAGIFTKKYNRYYIYYPSIRIRTLEHNYLSQIDVFIKSTSQKIFFSSLSQTSSALLLGMVFGGRQGMPQYFLDQLRVTGVIHVIAASGMNVTMVATVLVSLLGKILKRRLALLLSIAGIFFYSFLAGFETSIVRAAIMAAIALSAGFFGRQYYAQFSLFITGFIMLFYQPLDLFDIGFQLSFLSTWGIISIKPLLPLQKFFLGEDIGTTLAAQIATLPVLFATFGQYGVLSLIVNICVLWTVPFLMVFGAVSLFSGVLFLPLGKFILWLAWPLLIYFEKVVAFFAGLNWVWKIDNLTWQFIVGYYLILLSVILFFQKRSPKIETLKV